MMLWGDMSDHLLRFSFITLQDRLRLVWKCAHWSIECKIEASQTRCDDLSDRYSYRTLCRESARVLDPADTARAHSRGKGANLSNARTTSTHPSIRFKATGSRDAGSEGSGSIVAGGGGGITLSGSIKFHISPESRILLLATYPQAKHHLLLPQQPSQIRPKHLAFRYPILPTPVPSHP